MDFAVVMYMVVGALVSAPIWMMLLSGSKNKPASHLPRRIRLLNPEGAVVTILEVQYGNPERDSGGTKG